MMRACWLGLTVALFGMGCNGLVGGDPQTDGGDAPDPTTDDGVVNNPGDTDTSAPPPTGDGCPGELPIEFDIPTAGTTSGGWNVDLDGWADNSNVACYTALAADEYDGPYAVYAIDIEGPADGSLVSWDVVVTPDAGVDLSLVGWQEEDTGCSPERGIGVRVCEAANRGGPGEEERISFVAGANITGFKIQFVVGAPQGEPGGGFSVRVVNTP